MKIKLVQIIPDPNQPRKTFKDKTLQELKNSYSKLGLIQPITVRPLDGKYQIVIGERRYRAALLKGEIDIECIIRNDIDEKTATEMQFAENSQQEDIPPLELGQAFAEHRDKFHLSRRELSEIIGIPMSRIETYEELYINLHGTAKHYVESGEIDASTAYEISTIKDTKRQEELAQFTVDEGLSQKAVRKLKPLVEARPHTPIANIYASQVKPLEEIPVVPEARDIIRQAELPTNLIELKMELEMVTTRIQHMDFSYLDTLSPDQALTLWQTVYDTLQEMQRLLNYLNKAGQKAVRRLQ